MTDETTKQAVVENTDEQAQPVSEEVGAQEQSTVDPLDALLAEYDDGVSTSQEQTQETATKPDEDLAKRLEALERQSAERESARDMEEIVGKVRGDTNFGDETFVEAWIDAEARKDPRLQQAWVDRHKSPKQFERVVAGLATKWADKAKSVPDANVTEDRMAVAAAVRGASKQAPSTDEIDTGAVRKMNDAEFEQWRKGLPSGG